MCGPTNVQQSTAASLVAGIAGNKSLDAKVKGFLLAGLACVGNYSHGKGYAPSGVQYHSWGGADGKSPSTFSNEGLNCWTALLFWAFKGGAIDGSWLKEYELKLQAVAGQMQAENEIMYSYLRANQVSDIQVTDTPPPGVTVFFGDPGWQRPLNHVVASLGGGYVVSQQSLVIGVKGEVAAKIAKLNPTIKEDDLYAKRLTHVSTIELIASAGSDTPRIRTTTKPFWELPRVEWKG